jgi:hypothetical protein
MTNYRKIEDAEHINFPVFEGEEPDDNDEDFDELDFNNRRTPRREDEETA